MMYSQLDGPRLVCIQIEMSTGHLFLDADDCWYRRAYHHCMNGQWTHT